MSWIQAGSTICFKPYSLEDALRGLSQAGFENVEIGAVKGFLEHLDPDDITPRTIAATRALLDRYGLRVVSLSGHAQIHTSEGFSRLRRVLKAGEDLGIIVINSFTGDAKTPQERTAFFRNVRIVADMAQEAGIRFCLETDSNLLPTARAGLSLLNEIGHDWIQINYDSGNVVYYAGERPEDDVRLALHRIGHVHLKDQRGGRGVLDFPPLGEGEVDVPSVLRHLSQSHFSGPVSMEIEFRDYEYPSWDGCLQAATRGKAYWDAVG